MMTPSPSSLRDPAGGLFEAQGQIYRWVSPEFGPAFDAVRQNPCFQTWQAQGRIWPEERIKLEFKPAHTWLKHPRFPFITYPYEWPFDLLKEAALFHLDLMIEGLEANIFLKDSSAFNIQFDGIRPIFLDHLSFEPYQPGQLWLAHRQFCEEFLYPLLLQSARGLPYHTLYRGKGRGIEAQTLKKLLPWITRLSPRYGIHVHLASQSSSPLSTKPSLKLPPQALRRLWLALRRWIEDLRDKNVDSHWATYHQTHSYSSEAYHLKQGFIERYSQHTQAECLWDLGANTGDFSTLCLETGTQRVISFDQDHSALKHLYHRAKEKHYCLTPLYMDMTNPSPNQGWNQAEWQGLHERTKPQGILALALLHHLVIGASLPLSTVLHWLLSLAPSGVIEFVPLSDPMAQALLGHRTQLGFEYDLTTCIELISQRAQIVERCPLTATGRELIWFKSYE